MAVKYVLLTVLMALLLTGCATQDNRKQTRADLRKMVEVAEEYYRKGLLSSAEAEYRKITKKYTKYYDAWLKLGNIYTRTGQLEAAVLAYQECLNRKPEEMRCWNNLAVARLKQSLEALQNGRSKVVEGSADHVALEAFYDKLVNVLAEE